MKRRDEIRLGFDDAMAAVSALAPALLAAIGASSDVSAAHDESVVRAVGLGFTGVFHAPSVLAAAPAMLVPIGPRVLRAALASAAIAGVAGLLLFRVARAFARDVLPTLLPPRAPAQRAVEASPRLVSAVAAALSLGATLAPAWQAEATAPGGAALGALVVLLALALGQRVYDADVRPVAFVLGVALAEEPLVFAASALAFAPWIRGAVLVRSGAARKAALVDAAIAFAVGVSPFALGAALASRTPSLAVASTPFANAFAGRAGHAASIAGFATDQASVVVLVAAGAGAAAAILVPAARASLVSLAGVVAVGALAMLLGAPADASRAAAPVLAALASIHVFAAAAGAGVVLAVARARVPFAQASAALVVVLELVIPVRAADETSARREATMPRAEALWTEVAWAAAPPSAVVLLSDRLALRRLAAARAAGEARGDLLVAPSVGLASPAARHALAVEPKLARLYRDFALGAPPEELSLAELASARPLVTTFDPRWDRALARHLVPAGLLSRFEAEPRGAGERQRALEAFAPAKERLLRVASPKRDATLAAATAELLRARAIGMAATGEREVLARALDDLRPFAPEDPVANELVRRIVTTKGPVDVHDLAP